MVKYNVLFGIGVALEVKAESQEGAIALGKDALSIHALRGYEVVLISYDINVEDAREVKPCQIQNRH